MLLVSLFPAGENPFKLSEISRTERLRVQAVRDQQAQPTAPAREPAWIGDTTSDTSHQNEQIIERADGIGCRLHGSVASLPVFGSFRVHGSHESRSPAPVLVNNIDWQETYKVGKRG